MPTTTRRSRRGITGLVASLATTVLATSVLATGAPQARAETETEAETHADEPSFTFVSSPDLFNADIGDLRTRGTRLVGGLNSWNDQYAVAVDTVFSRLASHDADAYLVPGDIVEGHWGKDVDRTGYFGPVRTPQQRLRAIEAAGDFYYGQFEGYFARHGVDEQIVYPAVGDHEIGDNPWRRPAKLASVATYKSVWADHFTADGQRHRFAVRPVGTPFEDTSYATWLTPPSTDGVILVTVDVFRRGREDVKATVRDRHLRWFESVLAAAPASATVIVQAHAPVLTPVRSYSSSDLVLTGGERSGFWRAMEDSGKVDLYLAGEVHATTARRAGDGSGTGPVQVTHGGIFTLNGTSYLHGRVYDDRVELDSWDFPTSIDVSARLWATTPKRPPAGLTYGRPALIGTLVLHDDGSVEATGALELNPTLP